MITPLDRDLLAALPRALATTVQRLLRDGANPNAQDENGMTALHLAALHGRHELVDMLVAAGADLRAKENTNCTPAQIAAAYNREKTMRAIVLHEARERAEVLKEREEKTRLRKDAEEREAALRPFRKGLSKPLPVKVIRLKKRGPENGK
jgi:ankyrin repeat protein